ncbi:MAG: tyrosine-type recombinase/integrase [Terracidiphilus sp.]|jgi:integrase
MAKYNAENERIKRRYFGWLKEAKQCGEATVDATAKALSRFEEYNRYKSFRAFHQDQAVAFKRYLADQTSQRSGERLSKATIHATLTQLRQFFFWLADQPGFKSRIQHSDADYFNLSSKDTRIAAAHTSRKVPTLEQVRHVIEVMPNGTEIERRDRALVAFTLVTGARDSAIASLKLKHIDLAGKFVFQDAREVKTKFSKTITTYFFPVGVEAVAAVEAWVRYLREEKLWGNDDPLFPATRVALGKTRQFEPCGLERNHWKTTTPIRTIFREAFERAGLPYFHPHSLRHTLARLGQRVCQTPEQFKAWSQNFGHEKVMTTFENYGSVTGDRQGEIIRGLATPAANPSDEGDAARVLLKSLRASGFEIIPAQNRPALEREGRNSTTS